MRLPWTKPETRATYTDQQLDSDWALVTSGGSNKADQVGMVCYGIRMFENAFAIADVSPSIPALTPEVLASIARRLILRGNALFAIDVGLDGLTLLPVNTWDIGGRANPSTWRYVLDIAGPSRDETRRVRSDGVIHCRTGAKAAAPWLGISPLADAGLSSRMISHLETRLGDEVSTRSAYLVPYPDGVAGETVTNLRERLKTATGGNGLIEAGAGGNGNAMRPMVKPWEPVRLGADVPQYNVELRRDVAAECLAALGINPALVNGDGAALRESFRQFGTAAVEGMAALVQAELSAKLERQIEITFGRLGAIDVAARARAAGTLAGIEGIDVERALRLARVQE